MRPALLIILAIFARTADGSDASIRGPWSDATPSTIGKAAGWSHKVEIADIDNNGRVDLLFANGGDHPTKGAPESNPPKPVRTVSYSRISGPVSTATSATAFRRLQTIMNSSPWTLMEMATWIS